jgi:predicted DNA-binding transcriptional regulator AlpA
MTGKLVDIPTLDSLMADPGIVQTLPAHVVDHILIQVTSLLPLLVAKSHAVPTTEKSQQEDRLLSIEEAAAILGKTKDWLYRHADSLPFTVREGRLLRFSSNGIQKYIRARLRQG